MLDGVPMIVLQVVIGLIVVFCVYRMSLWILKKDQLVLDGPPPNTDKQVVKIVDGYAPTSLATNRAWNTVNPQGKHYAGIRRSFNRRGGAQFSYSFWLYLEDTSQGNVGNKMLLLRGDSKPYSYDRITKEDTGTGTPQEVTKAIMDAVVVKAPLIRFGPTFDSLVIELNTMHNPNETIHVHSNAASGGDDPTLRYNMLKLMQRKWVLLTFSFEDNIAINDFENGIVVRTLVNDTLYHTGYIKSTLRQNNGDVIVLPSNDDTTIKNGRIGDVTYYNYAMSTLGVKEVFERGPPRYACEDVMGGDSLGEPLYLSEYNKLDIYNT